MLATLQQLNSEIERLQEQEAKLIAYEIGVTNFKRSFDLLENIYVRGGRWIRHTEVEKLIRDFLSLTS